MMRARMATFAVDDPAKIVDEIATTRRYLADGQMPEGIPATGFLMLVDREGGRVIEVMLFENEGDLRAGDATMDTYAPGEGSMHRVSVDRLDVPVAFLTRG
jgi:hypothetical protein